MTRKRSGSILTTPGPARGTSAQRKHALGEMEDETLDGAVVNGRQVQQQASVSSQLRVGITSS